MPAKSRRNRGKNLPPSKRNITDANDGSTNIAETSTATTKTAPVIVHKAMKQQLGVESTADRYPYIKSKLLMIGILAVVMAVVLGILAAIF